MHGAVGGCEGKILKLKKQKAKGNHQVELIFFGVVHHVV